MNTQENNKLIAEFMGMQKTDIGWYDAEKLIDLWYTTDNTFDELLFNKSWDWLKPVVKKCREESNEEDSHWEAIYYTLEECDRDVTHQAVVEFIKWYNENN